MEMITQLEHKHFDVKDLLNFLTEFLPRRFADGILKDNKGFSFESLSEISYSLNKNRYWDYLNIDILEGIMENFELSTLFEKLSLYKEEMKEFIGTTTVQQFYNAERRDIDTCPRPPDGFIEWISTHSWNSSTRLAEIESYRYNLESMLKNESISQTAVHGSIYKAAIHVIFVGVEPGSVRVIMFVSELVVECCDINFLKNYKVVEIEVNHTCIYKQGEVPC